MSIFPDFMSSILAMDAYNRGYNPGVVGKNASKLVGLSGGLQITVTRLR
jgi:hypothetical protein